MPLFAIVTLVFLGIASLLVSLFYLVVPKKTVLEERIESLTPYKEEFTILERPLTAWQKFLGRLGKKIPLRPQDYGKYMKLLVAAGLAILGFLIPTFWLRNRLNKRQIRIFHDLPDMLDLMTVCVEAGLSMDAAMIKVCEDEQFKKSPLAKEVKQGTQGTRAGNPRL